MTRATDSTEGKSFNIKFFDFNFGRNGESININDSALISGIKRGTRQQNGISEMKKQLSE